MGSRAYRCVGLLRAEVGSMNITDTIASLRSQLQAQRTGHVLPERYRPRVDLDDPDLLRRLTAEVEGCDDPEPVKAAEPGKRRRRRPIVLDAVEPDKPITLATAVRLAFPDGGMTVSGLRNEIAKGNLRASKMSGQIYVTLNDIERMRELCTIGADDRAKERGSICESEKGDGSFSTSTQTADASSAAQAHLSEIVQELKRPLPNTSRRSTSRTSATVTRLKF